MELVQLIQSLSELVRRQLVEYDIGDLLDETGDIVTRLAGAAGAGVFIGDAEGRLRFVSATDDRILRLEMWQEANQDSPCVDVFSTWAPLYVSDLQVSSRWAAFADVAGAHGMRSLASLPMAARGVLIGTLNVYDTKSRQWAVEERATAQLVADLATLAIVNSRRLDAATTLTDQLQNALNSRILLEQAKGILAERHGIDVAEAFALLRRHARDRRVQLHHVARSIVDGRLDLRPGGGGARRAVDH